MTVSTQVNGAHPDADLVEVAEAMGIFVRDDASNVVAIDNLTGLQELTKRQFIPLDEILREKTNANDVVESSTVEKSTIRRRIRSAVRAIRAWVREVVKTAREAIAWLAKPLGVVAEYYRNKREPGDYTGRHRTQAAWYGSQRSTASRVRVQRRRLSGRQPTDREPALPNEYWASHIVRAIEAIRGHEDALHPRAGYQFKC